MVSNTTEKELQDSKRNPQITTGSAMHGRTGRNGHKEMIVMGSGDEYV